MKPGKIRITVLLIVAAGLLFTTVVNCGNGAGTGSDIFDFQASYALPADVAVNASDTTLAAYAWQEFLALNWKSSYSTDGRKGEPDTSWNYFSDEAPFPDTIVWETFAHRSELSPWTYPMRPFDSACSYSYQYAPQPGAGSPSFGLLNNLDETSEIGSCNLFAFTNAGNLYTDSFIVRYQAKVNRAEYDYIRNTFPTQDSLDSTAQRTQRYIDARYSGSTSSPSVSNLLLDLPDGSVEIKSAWRELKPGEDSSQFFTRKVIVYSAQPVNGNTFTYTNKLYALIGLHIIHKSPNHPSFVFATFEHIGVEQDSMQYILLSGSNPQTDSLGYMKPIRNPISSIDSQATAYVHSNLLPTTSVWQHYRLVGVQGTPTSDVSTPNFFLANYVIESDSLLARFHGSGFSHPFNAQPNVYYNQNLYSVGGCQGCHGGGAQHSGTDFSFIVNSPNSAPDPVIGPAISQPAGRLPDLLQPTKLQRLKQTYR